MSSFNLTYIVATRNRLEYLKILFDKFLCHSQPDEEIIVIDAGSTDGSREFLQEYFDKGKIHQFVSEPDKNQAHGWNKGLLLAQGKIIKKLIDDDVHSLAAIRACKNFMLDNPAVDICISDCLQTDLAQPGNISKATRLKHFEAWKNGETNCFSFSDVYMLIRRTSLSYLGLYDTQFRMMDWEYSLRCSFLQANIAYYTGCNALSVNTPGNITSQTNGETLKREAKIGEIKYNYQGDRHEISMYSEIKIAIGKAINYKSKKEDLIKTGPATDSTESLDDIYGYLYKVLEENNRDGQFGFILK